MKGIHGGKLSLGVSNVAAYASFSLVSFSLSNGEERERERERELVHVLILFALWTLSKVSYKLGGGGGSDLVPCFIEAWVEVTYTPIYC